MGLFSWLFKAKLTPATREEASEEEILNAGLDLALAFGPDWQQPVQQRLGAKFGFLTPDELNHHNQVCRAAMNAGLGFVGDTLYALCSQEEQIKAADLQQQLAAFLRPDFPWISPANLARLQSQGCYYAFKDGLDRALQ